MRHKSMSDEELLSIARQVILEHGTSVSVQKIADAAGLSQPALFKRFGTKKNIIQEAFKNPKIPKWITLVEKGISKEAPLDLQLLEITKSIVTFFNDLNPIIRVMKSSGISHLDLLSNGEEESLPAKGVRLLSEWFERCHNKGLIKEVNYRVVASSLLGMVQVETFLTLLDSKGNGKLNIDEGYLRDCVDIILNGIVEKGGVPSEK